MFTNNFFDNININNVDPKYQEIVEEIGVENFIKLMNKFGGSTIYIPKLNSAYSNEIKSYVISQYNGYNKKKLANKFGLSEKTIQNIISENIKNKIEKL